MKKIEKWEDFLSRAMVGKLGADVKKAIIINPVSRDDMEIVIKSAIEFGGLSDDEVIKKYGPSPFS